MKIKTNHVPRDVIFGFELTEKERKEFDYYESFVLDNVTFFRYKGNVYDISDFTKAPDEISVYWDGFFNESSYSGVVVRFTDNSCEQIIVGTYYC